MNPKELTAEEKLSTLNLSKNVLFGSGYDFFNKMMNRYKDTVCIDIGANDGGYTQMFLDNGFKEIHCFEPVPDVFEKLYKRFVGNTNVNLNNLALSDKDECKENQNVFSSWTLKDNDGTDDINIALDYKNKEGFSVEFIRLDRYCFSHLRNIGFIKLDADGYELRILTGGSHIIAQEKPIIMCEFSNQIELIGDKIWNFVGYIFEQLHYDVISFDGKKRFFYPEDVLLYYPYHSSFDVWLVPKNWKV